MGDTSMLDPDTGDHDYIPPALNMSHDVTLTPKKNAADVSLDQIVIKSTPLPEMTAHHALSDISFFYEDGLDGEESEEAPDKSPS